MKKQKENDDVYVIIPGLNEEKHIADVVRRTIKKGFKNVIFVDDGSKDLSGKIAEESGATVLTHMINLGKGAAATTGCEYALKKKAKIIVLMDSDGQHKPEDIPKLLRLLNGNDIVFGSRVLHPEEQPFVMRFGNWFISTASRYITGIKLQDTQTGFRAMTAEAYKKIRWHSSDYSMESEMIANTAKHKLKYAELPIDIIYHDKFKGTTVFVGVKIFINILRFWMFGGKE